MKNIVITMLMVFSVTVAGNVFACDSNHPHQSKSSTSAPVTPATAK